MIPVKVLLAAYFIDTTRSVNGLNSEMFVQHNIYLNIDYYVRYSDEDLNSNTTFTRYSDTHYTLLECFLAPAPS